MTTVTAIIPTWNRAASVGSAVQSVLQQTVAPLEVLVCDDGSTDSTETAIRDIGDERVKWLIGDRAGRPAVPRNRGIGAANGEWIAFLDDDDLWLPNKLETQLSHLSKTGVLACCSDAWRRVPGTEFPSRLLGEQDQLLDFDALLQSNRVITSSLMLHRTLIPLVEGFPESPLLKAIEDYALWLRVSCLTRVAFLSEPLVIYSDNPMQSIRKYDIDAQQQKLRVLDDLLSWLKRRRPHQYRVHARAAAYDRLKIQLSRFIGRG